MSKRTVIFAILFIVGMSVVNLAVLIEASNQEDALIVDPFEQQPVPAAIRQNHLCNFEAKRCWIENKGNDCVQEPRNCHDG